MDADADASAETREGEEGSEPGLRYHDDPSGETRPSESFAARRADALGQLAETYLAHGPKSTCTADRYQVVVHVSAETLKQEDVSAETQSGSPEGARPAGDEPLNASCKDDVSVETLHLFTSGFSYIEAGPHIAAETARRLSCHASKVEVTDDERGEPLNIGRKSRVITAALHRALCLRDDGCRFPGCTHQRFIDGHHIEHWTDGGETRLDKLVQLCRYHHRLVHEHGFGCERTQKGEFRFTNPLGNEVGRSGQLPPINEETDPRDWLRKELVDIAIDSNTGVTLWRGERIDWPLAVGHLFDR